MYEEIIPVKLDVAFKKMFGDIENEDLLHDFLSSILDIPYNDIQKIEVMNPGILPENVEDKFSTMDLKLQVDDRLINVEMQMCSKPDYKDRTLYYWAKLYSGELKSGDNYGLLKQAIAVNILNFNMFKCKEFQSHFKIMETSRHEVLSEKCAIHFFELQKTSKIPNKDNKKELWLQLINAETEEELTMLENTGVPSIQKAVMVVHEMSADEKMRESIRIREKALHDEASALKGAREEGLNEGRKEGREEVKLEIISKMKAFGMTEEQINAILSKGKE